MNALGGEVRQMLRYEFWLEGKYGDPASSGD